MIAKCFPYYITVNFEALILCYTGEYLSSKVRYLYNIYIKNNIKKINLRLKFYN